MALLSISLSDDAMMASGHGTRGQDRAYLVP